MAQKQTPAPRWYAETGKSLGSPAAGALGQPGAVHGLAGGVLCVDLSKTEWLFMRYRRLFLLGLQFKETLAIVACR